MLPLKELEFRDLLLYMKSDKIKVYKIGSSARFIKVQGVITLYYNYSHLQMKYIKVGVMNQNFDLWSFKEFINFYYTNSSEYINRFTNEKNNLVKNFNNTTDKSTINSFKNSINYFDEKINKNLKLVEFINNNYSEYLV